MAGSCEYDNELWGSVKDKKFLRHRFGFWTAILLRKQKVLDVTESNCLSNGGLYITRTSVIYILLLEWLAFKRKRL